MQEPDSKSEPQQPALISGGASGGGGSAKWAWGVILLVIAAAVLQLRLEGRRWWCAGGRPMFWVHDIWSEHNSQHLADPYSLTHFSHGLIFFVVLWLIPYFRGWSFSWRLCIATAIEAAWEVLENTPMVINRYREATISLGYTGDTIVNSLGDIGACMLGFFVASRLGWKGALILLVALELVLLFWIRDNLALSVVMLLYPLDAIRDWQMAM